MKKIKKIALSAVLSALGVVFLFFGSLIDVFDLSAAILASLLVLFCVVEIGYSFAASVYALISILSFLLLPNKAASLQFICLFGYLPITKFLFERLGPRIAWLPKLLLFNGVCLLLMCFGRELMGFSGENDLGLDPNLFLWCYLAMGNVGFVLCDILYGRLLSLYFKKYRNKFRKFWK